MDVRRDEGLKEPVSTGIWPEESLARVPYWVYQDEANSKREMERLFESREPLDLASLRHWICVIAIECSELEQGRQGRSQTSRCAPPGSGRRGRRDGSMKRTRLTPHLPGSGFVVLVGATWTCAVLPANPPSRSRSRCCPPAA